MIKKMNRKTNIVRDQQGLVSIFSVLIIMGILTLIVIGFSNITRQAQRRTLDDQLSTQAFYAAETGINRVDALLQDGTLNANSPDKTDCTSDTATYDYAVDTTLGIQVSCLLVDFDPTTLEYGSVPAIGQGESIVAYASSEDPTPITRFTFSWDSQAGTDPLPPDVPFSSSQPRLFDLPTWADQVGIVRVDLVPITDAASMARADMATNTYTFFLYPSDNAGAVSSATVASIASGTNNQGTVLGRRCIGTSGYRCAATVQLTGALTSNAYYLRMHSYYNATRVMVSAVDANGNDVSFYNGQAKVDATGRSQDVSRRIQVRIPLTTIPGLHEPFSILNATSICKRIITAPAPAVSTYDPSDGASADSSCNLNP